MHVQEFQSDPTTPGIMVGRERELAELRTPIPGRMTVVSGPAGIGRTRLVSAAAASAEAAGWLVLWGRCSAIATDRGYWPWLQVFRSLMAQPQASELATLLDQDADHANRLAMFDAAALALREHSARQPILIILDDLHEADIQSLLMTRLLLTQLPDANVQLIGTVLAGGHEQPAELRGHLELILRDCRLIELRGLPVEAVKLLIADERRAEVVWAASAGNPLLIEQLTRSSAAHPPAPYPAAETQPLLALVRARVRALSTGSQRALTAMAGFRIAPTRDELAEMLDLPPPLVDELLAPAIDAEILTASAAQPPQFDFSHRIFAEAVTAEASEEVLAELRAHRADSLRDRPIALARHLLLVDGTPDDDLVAAVLAAASQLLDALAFEDAACLCQQAIDRLPTASAASAHVDLLIMLATARWCAGNYRETDRSYDQAWQWATKADDLDAAARVALGPQLRFEFSGPGIVDRVQRCQWVLDRLPAAPSALRVKLLATIAAAQFGPNPAVAAATARAAAETAATVADPVADLYALAVRSLTDVSPENVEYRIRSARRILTGADQLDAGELAQVGYFLLLSALLEKGDIASLDVELSWRSEGIDRFPDLDQGRTSRWFSGLRAILDGDVVTASRHAAELLEIGERQGDPDALSVWIAHTAIIAWMRGDVTDAESLFLRARKQEPNEALWGASLGWLWLQQGRDTAANRILAEVPAIEDVPRNRNWIATAVICAEIAILNDDENAMARLREALLPYAKHVVPVGIGVAFWGTASRTLGLLAERLGHHGEAREHLHAAIEICAQTGAHAWLAEAQIELAGFESRRGGSGERASGLLQEALAAAQSLGLGALKFRAEAALAQLGADRQAEVPLPATAARPDPRPRIHVMGKFEVLASSGERARWTSRKARELLKILVSRRGIAISREVLMDELWPGQDPAKLSNRFAVALNTVRRSLDPDRAFGVQHFVELEGESIRLHTGRIGIDVEEFLARRQAVEPQELRLAVAAYPGDVFSDEPYADWAVALRTEAQALFCDVALRLADHEAGADHQVTACELLRSVIAIDPYNESAQLRLGEVLTDMGAHGQAKIVAERLAERLAELGGPPD